MFHNVVYQVWLRFAPCPQLHVCPEQCPMCGDLWWADKGETSPAFLVNHPAITGIIQSSAALIIPQPAQQTQMWPAAYISLLTCTDRPVILCLLLSGISCQVKVYVLCTLIVWRHQESHRSALPLVRCFAGHLQLAQILKWVFTTLDRRVEGFLETTVND